MLTLITPATTYAITLDDAKRQCSVEDNSFDDLLTDFIKAATDDAEAATGLTFMTSTWQQVLPCLDYSMSLTKMPVQSVSSVKYYDQNNDLQTLDSSLYTLLNSYRFSASVNAQTMATVFPPSAWRMDAVQIEYVAGFSVLPERAKQMVRLGVADYFANRESTIPSNITTSRTYERLAIGLRGY